MLNKMQSQLLLYLLVFSIFLPSTMQAVHSTPKPPAKPLEKQEVEKHLGRKLTLKERIAFFILKKKAKKYEQTTTGEPITPAVAAIILGGSSLVTGLLLFALPYAILAWISILAGLAAVVFGIISLVKIGKLSDKKGRGRGIAILGMIVGFIVAGFWLLLINTVGG